MSINTFPPQAPTLAEAREALAKYPYYTLPALMALKAGNDAEAFPTDLLQRLALTFTNMDDMPVALSDRAAIFDNFYPDEQRTTPGTMDTIDTFLSTFGSANEHETDALEKLIFSGIPDYGAVLASEEKDSVPTESELNNPELSEQDRMINTFIASTHAPQPVQKPASDTPKEDKAVSSDDEKVVPTGSKNESATESESEKLTNADAGTAQSRKSVGDTQLTESFVRILVKNRNYSKAIEIISELSLNNPKKSIYFADQIRFLKKLIINENNK